MNHIIKFLILVALAVILVSSVQAQNKINELKLNLNEDGTHFVKATFVNQTWLRYNYNNPGSTISGTPGSSAVTGIKASPEAETFDIGMRRTRIQLFGQVTDHFFFYAQVGQNNFSYLSPRKTGLFFHDVLGEYNFNKHLSLGTGLTGWTGFSRFSSPSVMSIMGVDAPLFLQATNDQNDQFLRKLSVYAKGKLGKLDYRVVLSKPFDFVTAATSAASITPGLDSKFSPLAPKVQSSGYISYQFKDQESNMTPYQTGTYLGQKTVLNVGGGFQYQPQAMWMKNEAGDTIKHAMSLAALDVYYDAPLNKDKGSALSVYAVVTHYDFGKNYLRLNGVMNPTDGTTSTTALSGGYGNAYPMIGTGNSAYVQAGYMMPKFKGKMESIRLMPYASIQYSKYEKLKQDMLMWEGGMGWYFDNHRSKLTMGLQNRPVYNNTSYKVDTRKSMIVLQYQVAF